MAVGILVIVAAFSCNAKKKILKEECGLYFKSKHVSLFLSKYVKGDKLLD